MLHQKKLLADQLADFFQLAIAAELNVLVGDELGVFGHEDLAHGAHCVGWIEDAFPEIHLLYWNDPFPHQPVFIQNPSRL